MKKCIEYGLAGAVGLTVGYLFTIGLLTRCGVPYGDQPAGRTTYVVSWTGDWRTFYTEEEGQFFRMHQKTGGHTNVSLAKRVVTEEEL